jgi:3-deoxy-D-manno-octulosonic-acid transferase
MHCASLGDFEQGRPILEAIRRDDPEAIIMLSFFSPSGYESQKNNALADVVFYLPMDGPRNARQLLHLLRPDLVLWVKYEFWYYYLTTISSQKIPLLMIAGLVRSNQMMFAWYGGLWRKMVGSFSWFFTQNKESVELLRQHNITSHVSVGGDTRFDRVLAIAEKFEALPIIEKFCGQQKVVVAGSTWPLDEGILSHYISSRTDVKLIIAPHEVDAANLIRVKQLFKDAIFYSELKNTHEEKLFAANVLIIDNIGMLSRLYHYSTVCFVGGGFNRGGIHNVLEAAVYGRPVVFGPVYEKFTEAVALVKAKGGFSIKNKEEAASIFNRFFQDVDWLKSSGDAAKKMVKENAGATQIVMDYIREKRLLMR